MVMIKTLNACAKTSFPAIPREGGLKYQEKPTTNL